MHRAAIVACALMAGMASAPVEAASFDCAKAVKPDEVAVCKHGDLSKLDAEMGALWSAYRRVPMYMGASGVRRDEADDFLRQRAACASHVACLRRLYRARIKTLRDELERATNSFALQANAPQPVAHPAASSSTLPPAIEAIIAGYADQCRRLGGTLAAGADRPQILSADFDGDGRPDYVIDPENMRCSAAATTFCGNGGCQITIAVSGDEYQTPIAILGGQPTLSQQSDGTKVDVWVNTSSCNVEDREKACWVTFSWKDGKVRTSYQARPRSR